VIEKAGTAGLYPGCFPACRDLATDVCPGAQLSVRASIEGLRRKKNVEEESRWRHVVKTFQPAHLQRVEANAAHPQTKARELAAADPGLLVQDSQRFLLPCAPAHGIYHGSASWNLCGGCADGRHGSTGLDLSSWSRRGLASEPVASTSRASSPGNQGPCAGFCMSPTPGAAPLLPL
jgi:hypothetical protein